MAGLGIDRCIAHRRAASLPLPVRERLLTIGRRRVPVSTARVGIASPTAQHGWRVRGRDGSCSQRESWAWLAASFVMQRKGRSRRRSPAQPSTSGCGGHDPVHQPSRSASAPSRNRGSNNSSFAFRGLRSRGVAVLESGYRRHRVVVAKITSIARRHPAAEVSSPARRSSAWAVRQRACWRRTGRSLLVPAADAAPPGAPLVGLLLGRAEVMASREVVAGTERASPPRVVGRLLEHLVELLEQRGDCALRYFGRSRVTRGAAVTSQRTSRSSIATSGPYRPRPRPAPRLAPTRATPHGQRRRHVPVDRPVEGTEALGPGADRLGLRLVEGG